MSKRNLDEWVDKWTVSVRRDLLCELGREPTPADIDDTLIRKWYNRINSHGCIEGHLPEFVQLDYAEKIVMKASLFDEMKAELSAYTLSGGQTLASVVEVLHARSRALPALSFIEHISYHKILFI